MIKLIAEKLSHEISIIQDGVQLNIWIEPMLAHVYHHFDNGQANYIHPVKDYCTQYHMSVMYACCGNDLSVL
jgi:hypothetical protein